MKQQVKLTILARLEGREILNEVGTVEVDGEIEAIEDGARRIGDAAGAKVRATVDLAGALRAVANTLDGADSRSDITPQRAREVIQRVVDFTQNAEVGTQRNADALTDELCRALGLPDREEGA